MTATIKSVLKMAPLCRCAVLAVVALSSLALVAALLAARPAGTARGRIVAAAGAVFFSIQTALLDAVVWTICFPLP